MRRVEGKSNSSSAVDVSADVDASEGRAYSSDGSMGDIFEYRGISSSVCNHRTTLDLLSLNTQRKDRT
jgi:hypothetical protein